MTYKIINIDLSISRIDEVYNLTGDSIKVINATSDCFIQFDDTTQDPINLFLVDEIKLKFTKFYISNVGVKNQSIKIIVSERFNVCDRISISSYTPEPIPKPIPEFARIININNPEPNVPIELDLRYLNFSFFNNNGSNIRIIDENHNPLPFYLCNFNKTARTGKLFFKTPNSINSALIYPDNLEAPSISDGDATFGFFDDFTGTTINNTKWNVVNSSGWSVGNGELRGSNTSGRLLSQPLFSDGVILEMKTRTMTAVNAAYTLGGFWSDTSNHFALHDTETTNFVINNRVFTSIGHIIPDGINILLQFIVQSTTVQLKIIRLDTNIIIYNATHTNSIINKHIMMGRRADHITSGLNRTYETFWDWVRVRKVTAATAVIV